MLRADNFFLLFIFSSRCMPEMYLMESEMAYVDTFDP